MSNPTNMAMMPMTTNNSTMVKALRLHGREHALERVNDVLQ